MARSEQDKLADSRLKEAQHEALLNQWERAYNEHGRIDGRTNEFTRDGPCDWPKWESQKPKILFLLKESNGWYHPAIPDQRLSRTTGRNIARWRHLIRQLFKNQGDRPLYPEDDSLELECDDIALVETKKLSESRPSSVYKEILLAAREDEKFLLRQIDLIAPHIIVCCNTADALYEISTSPWDGLISKERCGCYKADNRLIIDFWHPGARLGNEYLFNLLGSLIKEGKVFKKFDWAA